MAAFAKKRVAAGAHLPTLWLLQVFERHAAKCPGDRIDYGLRCSSLRQCEVSVSTGKHASAETGSEQ